MVRKTRLAARHLVIAIATLLPVALAHGAYAAPSRSTVSLPVPQFPVQPTPELQEIWAHGMSLVPRIVTAQNDFYALYNKVNEKDGYDITCGYARMKPEILIMSRTCLPAVLGRKIARPMNSGTCVHELNASTGSPGHTTGPCIEPVYDPPRRPSISRAGSADLQAHLTKVTSSDPQLLAKAAHVGELLLELDSVQKRFHRIKGIDVKVNPNSNSVLIKKVKAKSRDQQ
jgi:hypothetical protein